VNQIVKLEQLAGVKEGTLVDAHFLKAQGLIKSILKPYKILGNGEIKKALTCQAYSFSKSAQEKIVKAGGKAEIIEKQKLKEQLSANDQ